MKCKGVLVLLIVFSLLFVGCGGQETIDASKYADYVCYDYHLACVDAEDAEASTKLPHDGLEYTAKYRKVVGETDEQFVCAWVGRVVPLASPDLAVMQPQGEHIDVWNEWTVSQIEVYYQDINESKPLSQEKEPARTPAKVIDKSTDKGVIDELVEFITNTKHSGKVSLSEDFKCEAYNDNNSYVLYIRVRFNESENIVWDSQIDSYVSEQSEERYIAIDKGRTPDSIASSDVRFVLTNGLFLLTEFLDECISQV